MGHSFKLPSLKPARVSQSIDISTRDFVDGQFYSRGSLDAIPSSIKPKTIIFSQPKSDNNKYSFLAQVEKAAKKLKGPADYKILDLEGFKVPE